MVEAAVNVTPVPVSACAHGTPEAGSTTVELAAMLTFAGVAVPPTVNATETVSMAVPATMSC